jgi:hypothetical protein
MWDDANISGDHAVSILTLKMEAAWSFKTMVSYHITKQHLNPEDYDLKHTTKYNITGHSHQ